MKDVYVLGVVSDHPLTFQYLSVHVSRNKAFVTAKQAMEAVDGVDMRMYEHEAGDRMRPGHFYLYRTALGEVVKDVGGGSQTENDQSILVSEYQVGMQREKISHEQDERVVVSQPTPNEEDSTGVE